MFKTILVPAFAGEQSEKAVTLALELAASQKAGVRFCHASNADVAGLQCIEAQQTGREILDAACCRAEQFGVPAQTDGDGADLIVMGSDAAQSVIQRAPVPVIVVGPNSSWDADSAGAAAYV